MALQRLYWIPTGVDATEGVYVRYPQDELLAVLCLESFRHRATVVGEDLGTVSPTIRGALDRHAIRRMFVFQFEATPGPHLPVVPASVMASLNTHDMAPFAGYWNDLDIADQRDLGLLDDETADDARRTRQPLRAAIRRALHLPPDASAAVVLDALLAWLAASPAQSVIVNLEDLWLESLPQNVPGTTTERPNWRRHAAHDIDEVRASSAVGDILNTIAKLRSELENDA
jgi:4-alpha-glucanotransferase